MHRPPLRPPLTDERLAALVRQARAQAEGYADPATGTVEIRVLELLAILEELLIRRMAGAPEAS